VAKKLPKDNKNIIIIRPKNGANNSKQTTNELKNIIKKSNKTIGVKEVENIGNGGVIVRCHTSEDVEDIQDVTKHCKDLNVSKPKQKKPSICVYGVESDLKNEDIIQEIIDKNRDIKDFLSAKDYEDIEEHLRLKIRLERRRNRQQSTQQETKTFDLVFEVSPELRKVWSQMRSVLIDWKSYRYGDHIHVVRCYKCQKFGHMSRVCTETDNSCGNCSHNHETRNCQKSESEQKCINCVRFNASNKSNIVLATNHSVFSRRCESLLRMENIIKSRINYE
jgi:hypothetical protein